jgi:hypothetical protein
VLIFWPRLAWGLEGDANWDQNTQAAARLCEKAAKDLECLKCLSITVWIQQLDITSKHISSGGLGVKRDTSNVEIRGSNPRRSFLFVFALSTCRIRWRTDFFYGWDGHLGYLTK